MSDKEEDRGIMIEFYKADREKMIDKLNSALKQLKAAEILITQSASGGKHDTGCFAKEVNDLQQKAFDKLAFDLSDTIMGVKQLIYLIKKD